VKTSSSLRQYHKLSLKRLQSGDTIVEVLIAIAIISLVLTGAFSTTHASLLATRTSQEHAEALKLLEGQIENIRAYNVSPPSPINTEPFCIDVSSTSATHQAKFGGGVVIPGSAAADPLADTMYKPSCQLPGAAGEAYKYYISIVYIPGLSATNGTYDLRARWDGFNGSHNQVELFYRYYQGAN
jgi:prepilin-type N-terminal cleavage/methylation domain-containing protein